MNPLEIGITVGFGVEELHTLIVVSHPHKRDIDPNELYKYKNFLGTEFHRKFLFVLELLLFLFVRDKTGQTCQDAKSK